MSGIGARRRRNFFYDTAAEKGFEGESPSGLEKLFEQAHCRSVPERVQ